MPWFIKGDKMKIVCECFTVMVHTLRVPADHGVFHVGYSCPKCGASLDGVFVPGLKHDEGGEG